MSRLAIGFLVSIGVTFGLFVMMSFLVKVDGEAVEKPKNPPIEINVVRNESAVQLKSRKVPEKPEPPKEPPPPQIATVSENVKVTQQPIQIDLSNIKLGTAGGVFVGAAFNPADAPDGDAIPMFTIPPRFPRKALMDGTSGWVKVQFDINPDGTISNATVVDAKPRRLFDKEALRAIRKWKFRPKVIDGKAVIQYNKTYIVDFTMEN